MKPVNGKSPSPSPSPRSRPINENGGKVKVLTDEKASETDGHVSNELITSYK